MPVRGNTFKIFVGNLSERTTSQDLREIFQQHGTVVEADAVKNYGFVHMQNEEEGKTAITALNGFSLHGNALAVEASTGAKKMNNQRTKIFVGNLSKDSKVEDLRGLFEAYGSVVELDILNNYAFLHMENETHAREAIRNLDGYQLHGNRIRVQESTSRVRQQAGMGNPNMCYRCGSAGHWSKECPRGEPRMGSRYSDRGERGRPYGGGRFDPYGPPMPPPSYARERMMRYRDDYDQYSRYDRYYDDPIYDRRYSRPGPPMSDDPYERRPPPHLPPLPPRSDYLRYGRRSPPPRYPPPPPPMSYGPPPPDRRPY